MKILTKGAVVFSATLLAFSAHAAIITVNTIDNLDFSAGKTNLYYALSLANTNGAAANTINFNISGGGPFYIKTPTNGYPLITNHDITINGYSQPGSAANSNPIHSPNNAQIKIVLDSRIDPNAAQALGTDMNYANGASNAGFGDGDVAILGIFRATNFSVSGLCFLGQFSGNYDMYGVAIACDEGGTSYNCHIHGCWFGVDVNGTSVVGNMVQAVENARHRNPGNTYQITSDRTTFGVAAGSANPRAEFNVCLGMIETISIEANYGRISGNFLGVYPSGNSCWIGPIDGASLGIGDNWRECHIEIGRANNNTVIGSDLDGVNDDQEGNVIGGTVDNVLYPTSSGSTGLRGYTHSIEFYGNNNTIAGTNYGPGSAIIANNYCGIGIDGTTRFTNGVPFSDGNPPTLRIENNVIFNNYPTNIFDPSLAGTRGFYDGTPNVASARKNKMVNNYPYPKNAGVAAYYQIYTKALAVAPTTAADVTPVITYISSSRLKGTMPIANVSYPTTTFDLYLADPQGIANGKLAADPAEPKGWVQGLTYLGSPANSSATPGTFDLDITGLPSGGPITVTANYSGTNGTLTSPFAAPPTRVNKSGNGDFTTIQAAINSGATLVEITDSGNYVENLEIGSPGGVGGDPLDGGPAVTLTSNQCGTNRPSITPSDNKSYVDVRQVGGSRQAGFGLFANNSTVANVIIEAQPDLGVGMGAMFVMATNVLIENCLFRITSGTVKTLPSQNPLLFFAEQLGTSGTQGDALPGGRDCNGSLARNCEFIGIAPDSDPVESTPSSLGYLGQRGDSTGTGQGSGYVRMDHYSDGRDVFVTFDGCYFHHDRDYGIFPSNFGSGAGSINVVVKRSRLDANGKFEFRGRGANIFVESSVFSRCNQLRNGDDENSAVSIQAQDGHTPSGSVSNSAFLNCGSANAQRAYYGGVNNHNGNLIKVDHCTFVDCLSGVSDARGGSGNLSVSNSIFHQIGDNVPPAVDSTGVTLTNGSPELVGGLEPAWTNGLANFGSFKWSAVFNRFQENSGQIIIGNCLVGNIATEDSRSWSQALTDNTVLGCRLFAGYDSNFVGTATVTRGTPVFVNTDPDAPNVVQLTQGSPGQGLGANLTPVLSPVLGFSRSGNQLTISWTQPLWLKGVLKSTPSLTNPVWTPVPGVTCDNRVTVTIGAASQYFAIVKQ